MRGYTDVSLSEDGDLLAACADDNRIQLWNARTQTLIAALDQDVYNARSMGQHLHFRNHDKILELESDGRRQAWTIDGNSIPRAVPSGSLAASEDPDDAGLPVHVLTDEERTKLANLMSLDHHDECLVVADGRNFLIEARASHEEYLYNLLVVDAATMKLKARLDNVGYDKWMVTQSGRQLICCTGGRLALLDLVDGAIRPSSIPCIAFTVSGNKRTLATYGGPDSPVHVVEVPSMRLLGILRGRTDEPIGEPLFEGDKVGLITSRSLVYWQMRGPSLLRAALSEPVRGACLNPRNQVVALLQARQTDLWNLPAMTQTAHIDTGLFGTFQWFTDDADGPPFVVYRQGSKALAFSSDGRSLFLGSAESRIDCWNFETGATTIRRATVDRLPPEMRLALPGPATALTRGSDGSIAYGGEGAITWLPTRGAPQRFIGDVACRFTPDAKSLIVVDSVMRRLFVIDTRRCEFSAKAYLGDTTVTAALVLTPDGRGVICASGQVTAYSLADLGVRYTLPVRQDHATLSTDKKLLITWTSDGILHLWDSADGRPRGALCFFHNGTDWAFIDPCGRFDGTDGGLDEARVLLDNRLLRLGQVDERYRSPGALAAVLRGEAAASR